MRLLNSFTVLVVVSIEAAFAAVFLWAGQAHAAQCSSRDHVLTVINKATPGLVLQYYAVDAGGNLLEVYITPEGGWVFVHTRPTGVTCITGSGGDWTEADEPLGGES